MRGLTRRELEVLYLISMELSNVKIGARLGISSNTVDTHRRKAMLKLEASNTAGLIRKAYETEVLPIKDVEILKLY